VTPELGFKVTVGKIGDFRPLSRQYLKTVEATIMQFSPYSSSIHLVFKSKFHPEILKGSPERGR